MKTYKFFFFIIFFLVTGMLFSQETSEDISNTSEQKSVSNYIHSDINSFTVYTGYGLNYGGWGVGVMYYPNQYFGIYGGLGFNYSNLTYEFGAKIRPLAKLSTYTHPYLIAQYGFNALVYVKDMHAYDMIYNGFSLGLGLDWSFKFMRPAYFSTSVLVPVRDTDAIDEYLKMLQQDYSLQQENELFPISFSFGINFPF